MIVFPTLKTGAAVQYPFEFTDAFSTEVLEFLAGDEQRYVAAPGSLRRWAVKLELLDDAERRSLESFFIATAGSYQVFSFADPLTGEVYPNCYIERDELRELSSGELRSGLTLIIREGRS